jgi:tRNA1(Val) A37 N6-methylase TrmN6
MKRKMYTLNNEIKLLQDIDNDGGQYTAEEYEYIYRNALNKNHFQTKDHLLHEFLYEDYKKLDALAFLIDQIKKSGYKNILSLGAGTCVLEYLLKIALPEESKIVACDFNSFLISKAQEFFPEIIAERFDFFKDDFETILSKLNIEFDVAVFFGSAYVMNDEQFTKLFRALKKNDVKKIIDFHAGYMDGKGMIFNCLKYFTNNSTIRKMVNLPPNSIRGYRGKLHGYSRSRGEIRKLYKDGGFSINGEYSRGSYKYVAVLG